METGATDVRRGTRQISAPETAGRAGTAPRRGLWPGEAAARELAALTTCREPRRPSRTACLTNGEVLMQPKPRVVILNGASSSGKTTIATAFRDQRAAAGDFWLLIGIDDFLAKIPPEWKSAGPDRGSFAADGIRFEITRDGPAVRVGNVGRQILRAYQAAVAAAARVGLNVIVDEVIIDRTSWEDWNAALAGLDVVWVGIRCAAEVAEERNRARGDRFAG